MSRQLLRPVYSWHPYLMSTQWDSYSATPYLMSRQLLKLCILTPLSDVDWDSYWGYVCRHPIWYRDSYWGYVCRHPIWCRDSYWGYVYRHPYLMSTETATEAIAYARDTSLSDVDWDSYWGYVPTPLYHWYRESYWGYVFRRPCLMSRQLLRLWRYADSPNSWCGDRNWDYVYRRPYLLRQLLRYSVFRHPYLMSRQLLRLCNRTPLSELETATEAMYGDTLSELETATEAMYGDTPIWCRLKQLLRLCKPDWNLVSNFQNKISRPAFHFK